MKALLKYLTLSLPILLWGCAIQSSVDRSISFDDLQGWDEHQFQTIKPTLLSSCQKLNKAVLTSDGRWGDYDQWQSLCKELALTPNRQLKLFFENNFKPIIIAPDKTGLFTGYFSPVIKGQMTSDDEYQTPLLKLPEDLVKVRPSDFGLEGDLLAGKVRNGYLKPYDTREDINQQTTDSADVLLWLKDPVDKYFLQVQGSGSVQLEDGKIIHVVYAGNNGHGYVSIGKVLREQGELGQVSTRSIKQWLVNNPEKQQWLFHQNPRYIFFSQSDVGAITSQGVPATANRTLAVDPSFIPLGMPVWLETTVTSTNAPYRQLMVAQDTGSAIKGALRGDIYFGLGSKAGLIAGEQQSGGKLYILVPR